MTDLGDMIREKRRREEDARFPLPGEAADPPARS